MQNNKLLSIIIFLLFGLTILFSFASSMFYLVESTERAVLFYKLSSIGLDKKNVITPGLHFKAPWNEVYTFDITDNLVEETIDVLDKNGLNINVDVTMSFHPMYDSVGEIYETFQMDYLRRLVRPEFRSTVRQVMGRYTAEEIYSTKRSDVENAIQSEASIALAKPGNNIVMRSLLIRSIALPEQIRNAIESKLQQEQEALAYKFRLQREESEAERKRIAAQGEAIANRIINNSLTPSLLRMRGIEATSLLAASPNTKVVIIGNSKDGLPLILGDN